MTRSITFHEKDYALFLGEKDDSCAQPVFCISTEDGFITMTWGGIHATATPKGIDPLFFAGQNGKFSVFLKFKDSNEASILCKGLVERENLNKSLTKINNLIKQFS